MNRMYRGKHIHAISENSHLDGNWFYGYLSTENYINAPEGEFLVDKNTIGQYVGRDDINNQPIFENDVVKILCEDNFMDINDLTISETGYASYRNHTFNKYILGIVYYDYDLCGYYIQPISLGENYARRSISDYHFKEFEVIGNTFDNPELLEV